MYMPDFEIPQDDLDDLLQLERETEMDLVREMEEAAFRHQMEIQEPKKLTENDVKEIKKFDPIKSPKAKRSRMSSVGEDSKNALEDISNFYMETSQLTEETTQATIKIPKMGERKFYRRIPLDSDYRSITDFDGRRFYFRLKTDDHENVTIASNALHAPKRSGFCGVPYRELLEQATIEMSKLEQSNSDLQSESGYESAQDSLDSEDVTCLWVEKFRPKSYLQLLSDDGTNRTLLRWLKLWDKLVHGTERKISVKAASKQMENQEKDGRKNQEVIDEVDENGNPKLKIALLHGPPGLGKTTLAHIVAKHAGYNVVEMNASDDRSVEAFKIRLEAATQLRSVSIQDARPNCLVIDEIDGAPSATIQFLVGAITGKTSANKKKQSKGTLQRPIICICNDLYTPSLRPLRNLALVIQFPPTLSNRLAQRLLDISSQEKLRTDLTALLALCEKTGDDIRSCLSTLQFFKSRGKQLRLSDVHKSHVGQKDVQKSYFTVWDEIFRIPRTGKRKIDGREENIASPFSRFKNVLHTVQACGDYERLQQGVFENYLSMKFKDSRMENVSNGQEWFCFFDLTNQQIMHTQNYSIMSYLSYSFVMAHFLFSSLQKQRISYPSTAAEKRTAQLKSQHNLETLLSDMAPNTKAFNPIQVLVRDTLPYIMAIIQPNLRPVNTHLYSKKERQELQNLIDLMISYNLNYVQEKTLEGSYFYRLEPNVEDVVYFENQNHINLPYAIKQMIAHEVELEIMRRREGGTDTKEIPKPSAVGPEKPKKNEENMRSIEELTKKLTAKTIQVAERTPVDFFGRPILKKINPDETKQPQSEQDGILSSDIWFKFKEGYNNAVRRNIRVCDLI